MSEGEKVQCRTDMVILSNLTKRGDGTVEDPIRLIGQIVRQDGTLLAEDDELINERVSMVRATVQARDPKKHISRAVALHTAIRELQPRKMDVYEEEITRLRSFLTKNFPMLCGGRESAVDIVIEMFERGVPPPSSDDSSAPMSKWEQDIMGLQHWMNEHVPVDVLAVVEKRASTVQQAITIMDYLLPRTHDPKPGDVFVVTERKPYTTKPADPTHAVTLSPGWYLLRSDGLVGGGPFSERREAEMFRDACKAPIQ